MKTEQAQPSVKLSYSIICLLYILVPVYTPGFQTLDANGAKFFFLSLLNFGTYIFLLSNNNNTLFFLKGFLKDKTGLAYALFMAAVLLSFCKANNISESVLFLAKSFTVFSAAVIISGILKSDVRLLKNIAIVFTTLLLLESVIVFYNIGRYITGKLDLVYDIKSFYANKNIFCAALFLKLPFALWLFTYEKEAIKKFTTITLLCGLTAVFFLSTRAFYIGTAGLTVTYVLFVLTLKFIKKEKGMLGLLGQYLGILMLAGLLFTGVQHFLYPQKKDKHNTSIASRLSTIRTGDPVRAASWRRSWNLIKENPVLGVGAGNWKIAVLQKENLETPGFNYAHKAHNDFIETTAETGVLGVTCYLSIFILIIVTCCKELYQNSTKAYLLFLPAFGIFCYAVDAFFNFPADRPEIQTFFFFFTGMAVGTTNMQKEKEKEKRKVESNKKRLYKYGSFTFAGLILVNVMILGYNFKSLRIQRILENDLVSNSNSHSSEFFYKKFPAFPEISAKGEPLAVNKAYFLFVEGKYGEVIKRLKDDRSSPYDTRQNYYIAKSYAALNNLDSAIIYHQKVLDAKPLFYGNVLDYVNVFERKGSYTDAEKILTDYLRTHPDNAEAYEQRAFCYFNMKQHLKSISDIDAALSKGSNKSSLYNLRGVCLLHTGKNQEACGDFQKAVAMGDKEAVRNMELFCRKNNNVLIR